MAYREPCSSIYLFKGCPCDRSYNNTIYFENKSLQWIYFRDHFGGGRTKSYTSQYYQRYAKGTLRIQERADNLYEFNYMAFCNDLGFDYTVGPTSTQKVFYCFIDSIEYINENVTEVTYTIDVIQSYMFNYTLGRCLVEREHTITDTKYEHLIKEQIDTENITYKLLHNENLSTVNSTNLYSIMVIYIPNEYYVYKIDTMQSSGNITVPADYRDNADLMWGNTGFSPIPAPVPSTIEWAGSVKNSAYNGCKYLCVDVPPMINDLAVTKTQSLMGSIIRAFTEKSCNIIDMQVIPRPFSHNDTALTTYATDIRAVSFNKQITISKPNVLYDNSGNYYTPKNKKLLSAPYSKLIVSNQNGDTREFNWEYFDTNTANFSLLGVVTPDAECVCVPTDYMGINFPLDEYSIKMDNFPHIMWSVDTYANFIAQNKGQTGYSLVANSIKLLASLYTGGTSSILTGSTTIQSETPTTVVEKNLKSGKKIITTPGTVTKTMTREYEDVDNGRQSVNTSSLFTQAASMYDLTQKQDKAFGKADYSSIRQAMNRYAFIFYQCNIRKQDAVIIDDYFSMFGYAIKRLKVPNIFAETTTRLRPHWNYIKNANTVVLPLSDNNTTHFVETDVEEALQAIYNKGITFWMNGEEVGNYSLDNSPIV